MGSPPPREVDVEPVASPPPQASSSVDDTSGGGEGACVLSVSEIEVDES